jgi:hypothetical protein
MSLDDGSLASASTVLSSPPHASELASSAADAAHVIILPELIQTPSRNPPNPCTLDLPAAAPTRS